MCLLAKGARAATRRRADRARGFAAISASVALTALPVTTSQVARQSDGGGR
jgi:hypothetical protein